MADGANLGVSRHFATVGVGVPLMIAIAEFVGIRKKDPHYMLMAKRWTRGFVISVAVGVVTGTAISLLLALVWPNFMQVAGNVIALRYLWRFCILLKPYSWGFICTPGIGSAIRILIGC